MFLYTQGEEFNRKQKFQEVPLTTSAGVSLKRPRLATPVYVRRTLDKFDHRMTSKRTEPKQNSVQNLEQSDEDYKNGNPSTSGLEQIKETRNPQIDIKSKSRVVRFDLKEKAGSKKWRVKKKFKASMKRHPTPKTAVTLESKTEQNANERASDPSRLFLAGPKKVDVESGLSKNTAGEEMSSLHNMEDETDIHFNYLIDSYSRSAQSINNGDQGSCLSKKQETSSHQQACAESRRNPEQHTEEHLSSSVHQACEETKSTIEQPTEERLSSSFHQACEETRRATGQDTEHLPHENLDLIHGEKGNPEAISRIMEYRNKVTNIESLQQNNQEKAPESCKESGKVQNEIPNPIWDYGKNWHDL